MTLLRKYLLERNYPKLSRLALYVFLIIVLISFIFIILNLDITDSIWLGDNFSDPYVESFSKTLYALRQDADTCLRDASQSDARKLSHLMNDTAISEFLSPFEVNKESPTFTFLSNFNSLLSSVGVKGAIIEPSILHCMVHPYYRDILSKRNFNLNNISGSRNVVTYGILGRDVPVLLKEENIVKFTHKGFAPYFVVVPMKDWMWKERLAENYDSGIFVSHIFFNHTLRTVHAVVFYERGNYLWHAGLESESTKGFPPKRDLLFVDYNGAYEKFQFLSVDSAGLPLPGFYVPSNLHYFLFETTSSRFLECNPSRTVDSGLYTNQPKTHPGMSVGRFNRRTLIALNQLKSIFHPLLMNFWIWSGTMLGWYRECDIIPYTSDVDFAAWASEIENLDLIVHLLLNNEHIQIKELMGMLEEALEFNVACHGLRADVFFLYQVRNGSWCSGHTPKFGSYFRYYYPPFTLCSAELLGQKVQVPCETEKLLLTEYGPRWAKPVSTWHYESSIKNRGPDIYWDKQKLKNSYIVYF